ncbi:enoyl-CoA hydratase/isomerase family protein [Nocardia brevicatena]|uniref:enoyl-CoA hydratase/isomerase family protein n=1 Tax=Nocardia brevicatena TaxID=37327 RepID=UPI00030F01D3|nr:enoyl-CoA hydratase/isomerase family protein [Nocardia brevicatena]
MTEQFRTLEVVESDDRITVILDRPEQRNAIDAEMIAELHQVCERLEREPKLLLLTGRGDHFAGGADINELRIRGRDAALAGINRNLFDRVARLPLPTVAVVNGYALGGGAELAYACDIRIATPTTVFANPEPGLGIMAAAGAAYRLPALIGVSSAKQVLLAGARIDAETALRSGLVMTIVADGTPLQAGHDLLDRIAGNSALALRLTKLVVDASGPRPLADDLAQAVLFETTDKHNRMTAFLEKRTR